jgi:hypothetical protein
MGFMDEVEKAAGAVIAVEGLKKVDPNAGILTEGAAAVAGWEGAGELEKFVKKEEGDPQS